MSKNKLKLVQIRATVNLFSPALNTSAIMSRLKKQKRTDKLEKIFSSDALGSV